MPDVIKTVGDFAGIGAFVGVSLLALLFFSQARDVRRLRDWAGRAPERAAEAEQALEAYETEATQVAEQPPPPAEVEAATDGAEAGPGPPIPGPVSTATASPPAPPSRPPRPPEEWQLEAEAAAEAELSARRERIRERSGYTTHGSGFGVRSPIVILAGGAILVFAIIFGAIHVLGGGGDKGTTAAQTTTGKKKPGPLSPGKIKVAVLNGTAVPGLAASVGDDVRSAGFKLGVVTNTESSFETTSVMYARGHQPESALVAKALDITDVQLMTAEITRVAKGAVVAVIVGNDRAPAGTGTTTPGTTTPGVTPAPGVPAPTATP